MSKFYITTPVYYVNDVPHIGHTYTTVVADVLARWHRLIGDKTFFLTGTDEHGANIENKAKRIGKEPKQYADEIAAQFQLIWQELNISHDNFIRTTNEGHIKAVERALGYMYQKGDIFLGKYEGLYCRGCEQFKSEHDLIDGLCPDHKLKPEEISEECYNFKLSKYQKELLKKIKGDELKILPVERKNEIVSFYEKQGLADVSFSRKNVNWGIPLPWDKSQTTYVWADAFLNYLTGLGWEGGVGKVSELWPPDAQLMSKDILRVHATIWPAMLLSLGLPLPKELFIHGYFLINGQKMSKTVGNVIAPQDFIKKYSVDATRYLLLSATSFGHDGDISWQQFDERYNADLANGVGNLVSRAIALAEKTQNLKLKIQSLNSEIKNNLSKEITQSWNLYNKYFRDIKIDLALKLINEQVKLIDVYITENKPWVLIKNNKKEAGDIIYNVLEFLRQLALMLWPFMPDTAEKVWQNLGLNPQKEKEKKFKEAIKWGGLKTNTNVKRGVMLFPRL